MVHLSVSLHCSGLSSQHCLYIHSDKGHSDKLEIT